MNKINLKKPLLSMDGTETGQDLNQVLANSLMSASDSSNPVKLFDWAIHLHNTGELTLDNSDLDLLKGFIKNNASMTVFAKGSLLNALNVKESKKA